VRFSVVCDVMFSGCLKQVTCKHDSFGTARHRVDSWEQKWVVVAWLSGSALVSINV